MDRFLIFCLLLLGWANSLISQSKHDFHWMVGYDIDRDPSNGMRIASLNFNEEDIVVVNNAGITNSGYSSSMADEEGNLLFYTNGCTVANGNYQIMPHGDSINKGGGFFETVWRNDCNYGYPGSQDVISLPDPAYDDGYYIFHYMFEKEPGQDTEVNLLLYSYVDMQADSGLGDLIEANVTVIDTMSLMSGYFTAISHSNGEDWWLLLPMDMDNVYLRVLLDSDGVHVLAPQRIGNILHPNSSAGGFTRFSPDGNYFTFYNCFNELHLYDFDRSTGLLSNFRHIVVNPSTEAVFTGHEWSPNSRFIYVGDDQHLWQVDTYAADIQADGIRLIDEWDGSMHPFANTINEMALGPDCKIYVRPTNGTRAWHTIHHPDELGTACGFVQNDLRFPEPTGNGTIPNFPRFRVDEAEPCDPTLTSIFGETVYYSRDLHTYPNPARHHITIDLPEGRSIGHIAIQD